MTGWLEWNSVGSLFWKRFLFIIFAFLWIGPKIYIQNTCLDKHTVLVYKQAAQVPVGHNPKLSDTVIQNWSRGQILRWVHLIFGLAEQNPTTSVFHT